MAYAYRITLPSRTQSKQAGQNKSSEQQSEADGELLRFGDGRLERLARRGVPDLLKRRRHGVFVDGIV